MKVSESPYGMTETYSVKFWFENGEGYVRQTTEDFYTNSKAAHRLVHNYAMRYLPEYYKKVQIISVIYS